MQTLEILYKYYFLDKYYSGLLFLNIVYNVFKRMIFTGNVIWALPIVTSSAHQAHLGILLTKYLHQVFLGTNNLVVNPGHQDNTHDRNSIALNNLNNRVLRKARDGMNTMNRNHLGPPFHT